MEKYCQRFGRYNEGSEAAFPDSATHYGLCHKGGSINIGHMLGNATCSSPHCLHASIGPMLIRALGSTTPSPLTRMAMNGHYAQGRPQIEPSHWSFMPPALGRLSERDQALTHLRWARDGFLNQGWPAPEVLPRWAPLYPDQQDAPRLAAWRPW